MLLCSVVALAVAIERAIYLWSFTDRMRALSESVKRACTAARWPSAHGV